MKVPATQHRFRRPVLAPGLRILEVSPGELQIGFSDRHRLRIPDTPAVRRVLATLERGEAPRDSPAARRALAHLAPALRDGDALLHPRIAPEEVAALILHHPEEAADRLRRRRRHRIRVQGRLGATELLDPGTLLGRCGLGIAADSDRLPPTAVLVLSHGEPDRSDLDHLVRDGVPHLLLRAVESEIILGPFVSPGSTACLRCLDAHRAQVDEQHPVALAELLRSERRDGVAAPVHSALAVVALGWAVGDLLRYAEGERPSTWSATLTFTPGETPTETVPALRHPGCGCSWGIRDDPADDARGSVTMGA
ncbi:hypothetical protein EFK50_16730 [Nocardioides marmoriginsengisoli]|uniref:TOMM leader peptide-binding protein n=1 Tax=Nocardioides marmoriginsengisoli TaxID=661483 RepID=A0A3N0CCQ9_9ACTN|nr:TOMM precursor leader peptide-binding protein [Nocardioides marmoriginsengisoli]RNL61031.1 hypothetical protein EFK50_16730 [Nocardioides marmoriginsengisoli]